MLSQPEGLSRLMSLEVGGHIKKKWPHFRVSPHAGVLAGVSPHAGQFTPVNQNYKWMVPENFELKQCGEYKMHFIPSVCKYLSFA